MAPDVGSGPRYAGIKAQVAISGTWGASHALARFAADGTAIVLRSGHKPAVG
jgi:hypothetical protein